MTKIDLKNNEIKIDEDLYSRQIIFLGIETMKKISQLKILIIGLRGLGVEIAKDIIVSGPNKVILFDPNKVIIEDLGSNFYLTEKDIGKRRDEACLEKLKKLNKYVLVDNIKEISHIKHIMNFKDSIIQNYNVIVITEILSKEHILFLDSISRENRICLIYSAVCGLSSFIFTDFGPNFTIYDESYLKKRKFLIKKIEKSEKGLVEIEWNKKINPNISDNVVFKEVEGMTELNFDENNKKIFRIKPKSKNEFFIGNTLDYNEYKSGGYVEEVALPKIVSYESFINKLKEPFTDKIDYVNKRQKFIFLVLRAIMEFYDTYERLPFSYDENDYKELKIITKNIIDNLNYENSKSFNSEEIIFNENIIKNICFTCSAEISCITSFIGGIICQEIIKTTGIFRPINQFKIFDLLQYSTIIPDSFKLNNIKEKSKYNELISLFGEKVVAKIRSLSILLAGAGALGCELLKNLALFGISNSVLVIDDDNIEVSNLNRQMLFHDEHKGLSKAKVACKSAKEINSDLKCNYLNKRISPENKDIFNKTYFENVDFVLGAIDSQNGNYYIGNQCELFEKIFIKGGTKGASGKAEIFIPNMTCSFNDIQFIEEIEEKSPSCTRRVFPGRIEDCIDNARDLFDEYFVNIINDFLSMMSDKLDINNEVLKKKIEISINKYYFIDKIIDFIKFIPNKIENELIKYGLQEFYKLFDEDIKALYKLYPINNTEESKNFWNNKRFPSEIKFNAEDELCINFIFYFIRIYSFILNLDISIAKDINNLKQKLNDMLIYINNKKNEKIDSELLYKKFILKRHEILNNPELLKKIKNIKLIVFEKNNPEFGHVQFVHSLANLKAKCYKIPGCNKFYTLEYVGKIAPTSITSTSVVGGFMCLQMIGIIINQIFFWNKEKSMLYNFEDKEIRNEQVMDNRIHNLCFNLKNNKYIIEPLYKQAYNGIWKVNKLIPEKFSRWYKIVYKGNKTIEEFINYIKDKYSVDTTLILSAEDGRVIFEKVYDQKFSSKLKNKKKERMDRISKLNVEDAFFETEMATCKNYNKNNDVFLKIKGFSKDGNYVEFPVIKFEKN